MEKLEWEIDLTTPEMFFGVFPTMILLNRMTDLIYIMRVDEAGNIRYVFANEKALSFCELDKQLYGKTIGEVVPDSAGQILSEMYEKVVRTKESVEFSLLSILPDGRAIGKTILTPVFDQRGEVLYIFSISEDATQKHRYEELLRKTELLDDLTNLPNRRHIQERFISNDTLRGNFVVYTIDLDRFKYVNDSLGHDFGDALLVSVAERLARSLPKDGLLGRMGGDEFIIVHPKQSPQKCMEFAETLIESLGQPFIINGHNLFVTASIGIAMGKRNSSTEAKVLMQNADIALYRAKEAGRSRYFLFEEDFAERYHQRFEVERALTEAIYNNQIQVHYQPIYDTGTRTLVGLEALARWYDPEQGYISPAVFIPVAEDTGLITSLTEKLLHQVCKDIITWGKLGCNQPKVSVNISSIQFQHQDFVDNLIAIIRSYGLPASSIGLEITESIAIHNMQMVKERLNRLRKEGFTLSLDDFGTGFSSLHILHQLPVHTLKIDRSFIQSEEETSVTMIGAILAMAKALNLRVVAEGVEKEEQLNYLFTEGCEYVQGFLLSRPLPFDKLTQLLQK